MPFRWHSGKYMCFYCSEHFIHVAKLREHTDGHTQIDMEQMKDIFRTVHRIKIDATQVCCTGCAIQLDSFDSYIQHLEKQHGQSFPKDIVGSFEIFHLDDEEMSCLYCDQTFRHFFQLLKHTHQNHTDVAKYLCEICGQGFTDKGSVTTHINQAHCVQQCKYCSDTFVTCYALDKHVGTVHKIEKCQCQFCFEVLPNRYMRKRHLALVHDWKSAQLKCDVCHKIFTRNNKLLLHKRRVHMKEKNISCEECGVQFFNMEALEKHQVRHRDERPFQCSLCSKSFKRKNTLAVHMAGHEMDA